MADALGTTDSVVVERIDEVKKRDWKTPRVCCESSANDSCHKKKERKRDELRKYHYMTSAA